MADIWNQGKRSEVMGLIRSHGNKSTEIRLTRVFKTHGITGWRRKQRMPGKPDFVFPKDRLCVFVDGCFWHGCPKCYRRPSSNQEYWDAKAQRNHARDRIVNALLRQKGWRVMRIWEHDLARKREPRLVSRIGKWLCLARLRAAAWRTRQFS